MVEEGDLEVPDTAESTAASSICPRRWPASSRRRPSGVGGVGMAPASAAVAPAAAMSVGNGREEEKSGGKKSVGPMVGREDRGPLFLRILELNLVA